MSSYVEPQCSFKQPRRVESVLSIASGALMILTVFRKRSVWRWTTAIAGGSLIYKGVRQWPETSGAKDAVWHALQIEQLSESTIIGKSPAELFALWRDPAVLARVMEPFGQVAVVSSGRLHWTLSTPLGKYESDAVLVEERPNEMVHWRTSPDNTLHIDETIRFSPAENGTGTETTLTYVVDFSRVPEGPLLRSVVSFFEGAPRSAIRKILNNFKGIAESA